MTTAKWTSIQERSRIYASSLQDLIKRGVGRCGGGDALNYHLTYFSFRKWILFSFFFCNFITWKKPWVAIQCHHVCTKNAWSLVRVTCAPHSLLHITSGIIKEKPIILDFENQTPSGIRMVICIYIPDWYQHFINLPQTWTWAVL